MGKKSVLKVPLEGKAGPVSLEAVVIWTQPDAAPGQFVTGVRTYSTPDLIDSLLEQLHASKRSNRIEELRSTDRFYVAPSLEANFGAHAVLIEDLSARGARIVTKEQLTNGFGSTLRFKVPATEMAVDVAAAVVW